MTRLQDLSIGYVGAEGDDRPHLSVDGMTETGPNLSHWPGNRTPRTFKRDLSTGICLAFAAAPEEAQRAYLGDTEVVLNNHYDTDGFLSMLAVTQPELALRHEEILLAAAGTGDFQSFHTVRGFAIDRTVLRLAKPQSPVVSKFEGLSGPQKDLARYRFLLDQAESILTRPEDYEVLWRKELDQILGELEDARTGGLERRILPSASLSVLTTEGPRTRLTLNTMASAYRVLHLQRGADGLRVRYHDRTESWFEVVTIAAPERQDLGPIAARLNDLEGDRGDFRWCADGPGVPIPELWFGADEPQAYGEVTRELQVTGLSEEQIVGVFAEALAAGEG